MVMLTDLIFFMQEQNGKYTFFSQDNKVRTNKWKKLINAFKGINYSFLFCVMLSLNLCEQNL